MITRDTVNPSIYFKMMMESVQDMILILTPKLEIEEASQSFITVFGLTQAHVQGKSLFEIANKRFDNPPFRDFITDAMMTNSDVQDYALTLNLEDSRERQLFLTTHKFYPDADQKAFRLMMVINDVTEINQSQKLMANHRANVLSNEEMDMIVSTVAHDLKNPISSMIGYASLIQAYFDRMNRLDILEAAKGVIDSGYHMHKIIDSLLLLAALDKDVNLPYEQLDTPRIIENVYQNLDHLICAKQACIDHSEFWPCAYGYEPWVETIWTNFISNAIKYGGDPPRIVLGAKYLDDGRPYFWVQDNGKGLPVEHQALIFKPFERIDGYKKSVEGNGLGLTIVRKIIDRIKGEIIVESEIGRGSCFGFILPKSL